ncbi:MAG: 4-hydroxythreonine-4-phosphate dehydrogenase PdxA [Candidatus Omnitrophica bacterium]|nr:4-hydroxythreonine-4-phosphate dehydrogenase PdxA [Candidatus Omnitrophota bacterium]
MRKPIIAITMGDPGGIGPEVIAKSLQYFKKSEECHYVMIGVRSAFEILDKKLGLRFPCHFVSSLDSEQLRKDAINFLDISSNARELLQSRKEIEGLVSGKAEAEMVFDIGKVSLINAAIALASLEIAARLASKGAVEALVTAPVNKAAIKLLDSTFTGHTEFLAKVANINKYAMMFVSDRLKVTLVTIHVPLKKVSELISEKLVLEKIRLTNYFLRTYFNIAEPRLAVCALNPHGKETGGQEEDLIESAVQKAKKEKINVTGPLAADQLFYEAYEGRYDVLVSMYHDQGLGPFKMIAFRNGVNTTVGLPFVRTSPDHGTAFDIAYQGKADSSSMTAALDLTRKLLFPQIRN